MSSNVIALVRKDQRLAERSDDELMLLSSAGTRAAFETLVRRHAARVVAFCAKNAGDRTLGEETAQEVWLSVWEHRQTYEASGKFVVWLFVLARNRLRNARRDRARRGGPGGATDATSALANAHDPSPDELDRVIASERRARVEGALSRVPHDLREAVVLRFASELPYEEIARVLVTSEETARSRVFHGLRNLRRRLRGEP
jgi:RNA polymerase sigma-70 factor (ECF subfamily)